MASKKEKTLPVVTHAVVLRSTAVASEFGEMLWAVLGEVAAFYNFDKPRSNFQRRWIGDMPPPTAASTDPTQIVHTPLSDEWWQAVQSSTGKLVDHKLLAKAVRELIPEQDRIIVITDEELKPPTGWRYIISWDVSAKGDGAASLAPLDPEYWGDLDPKRHETIKWRIRAAVMAMTGTRLGFRSCENTLCYLYSNVDSVTVLDSMVTLGPEHAAEGLTDKIFSGEVDDLLGLEAIIEQPESGSEY